VEKPDASPEAVDPPPPEETPPSARSDLADSLGWIALGVAVLIGSVTMDRLERQHINPYTVPGLLPGLLGIAMIGLGGVLALRSGRRGALRQAAEAPTPHRQEERRRIWIVIGLCVGYGVVLIGHGLPFWLASAIYVTGSILILHRLSRDPDVRRITAAAMIKALAVGLGAGIVTQAVFQELFLVRMP
jgi:hypothetical protein